MPPFSETAVSSLEPVQPEIIAALESALGHVFKNRGLLTAALTHRSYVHQFKEGKSSGHMLDDNQRLEFLGDSVLSLCVSTMLYELFPGLKEGDLSKMRAGLINEARLADLARQIGLDRALLLGRGEETSGGRTKSSILADALEAILAAVYLDGGLAAARQAAETLWGDLVARSGQDDFLKDFKTRLQEQTQAALGQTPEYRLAGTHGPDHARLFEVDLVLAGRSVSTGRGRSKKEAEQEAARLALEAWRTGAWSP
ncbi:MAG: ribonuclease III [Thermodesulfobacteriota bacterium]